MKKYLYIYEKGLLPFALEFEAVSVLSLAETIADLLDKGDILAILNSIASTYDVVSLTQKPINEVIESGLAFVFDIEEGLIVPVEVGDINAVEKAREIVKKVKNARSG